MKNFHDVGISFDHAPNRLKRYLVLACTGLLLLLFSSCGNIQSGQGTASAAAQRTPTFTGSSVRAQVSTRIAHTSGVTKVDASYQAHC
jgi:hypothetical protein